MSIKKTVETLPFSPEAKVIRQLQKDEGNAPCYATPVSSLCNRKECGLRHDCFEEAVKLKEELCGSNENDNSVFRKSAETEIQSQLKEMFSATGK